jgi:hypothetical protein
VHENPRLLGRNHNIWRSAGGQKHRKDFIPGQCIVHCLTTECEDTDTPRTTKSKKTNAATEQRGNQDSPSQPCDPKQTLLVSEDLLPNEEEKLISCLNRNKDVFAWSALDLIRVSRTIIEHNLGIYSSVRPNKQKLQKMFDEKTEVVRAEVHYLLEAKFIEPIAYLTWLTNVIMV